MNDLRCYRRGREHLASPRSTKQCVFNYLEENRRYKTHPKSELEEDERGGTVVHGGDAG